MPGEHSVRVRTPLGRRYRPARTDHLGRIGALHAPWLASRRRREGMPGEGAEPGQDMHELLG